MTEKNSHLPFYISISQITIGVIGLFFILYIGQEIILPLIFATIIAILLNPVVNFLNKKGCNRVIAISISVLVALMLLTGLIIFIGSQLSMFSDSLPGMEKKFIQILKDAENSIADTLNIDSRKITEWVNTQKSQSMNNTPRVIGKTLTTISGAMINILLMPVYIFLILYYKVLILSFIAQLFPVSKHKTVVEILAEVKVLVQSYLVGLLIEAAIVTTLNSVGLLILGIQYAVLIGLIGALLNLVPYIGGIVAMAIPMLLAIATKEPVYALYVVLLYTIVQLLDNNFIVPMIVASKVKINALVSIIVVLIGGALWGVPGMFLSLPLTAICKVVFDRVDPLKPLGFLIGDNMPLITKNIFGLVKDKHQPKFDSQKSKK